MCLLLDQGLTRREAAVAFRWVEHDGKPLGEALEH